MKRGALLLFAAFFGLLSMAGDQVVFQIEKMINRLEEQQTSLEEKLTENSAKLVADTHHFREAFFDLNHSIVLLLGNNIQLDNNYLRYRESRKNLNMYLGKTEKEAEAEEQNLLETRRNEIGEEFRRDINMTNEILDIYIGDFVFECPPTLFNQANCSEAFTKNVQLKTTEARLNIKEAAQLKLGLFEEFLVISQKDIEELNAAINSLIEQISQRKLIRQLMLISTLVFNLLSLMTVFIYFKQLIGVRVGLVKPENLN